MTIATTNTAEFSIASILQLAAKMSGVLGLEEAAVGAQWELRAEYGRGQLELVLKALQSQAFLTRDVEFYTVTLTDDFGGENDPIELPADTVSVEGTLMYRESADDPELQVTQVDREYWQTSLDKETTAVPTRVFVSKGATIRLYLLPVPDTAGATIRIQRKRLLADSTPTSSTVELERHWQDYLVHELASRYALTVGELSKASALKALAEELKRLATSESAQGTNAQAQLNHSTSWNR